MHAAKSIRLLLLGAASACALPSLSPYPLEGIVEATRAAAAASTLLTPTGLKRADYLPVIQRGAHFWVQYQAANGSIIDPYAKMEIQYATPCFAFAAATAAVELNDSSLLEPASLALDSATRALAAGVCPQGHCNFFTFPVMMAYYLLAPIVAPSRASAWEANLRALKPNTTYINLGGNWGLVAVGGEFLRTTISQFGDPSWWIGELSTQLSTGAFTANGQYQDHSGMAGLNPLPYDTFPCKYISVMLAQGYNVSTYPYADFAWQLMQRSAQTHLLMQSPWGEIPTGGRSSQHTWNEAASAVIYELNSNWAREAGDTQGACMFKRAAHLSLASVARWQNADGSLQIVKNHFDPALRFGYEEYSYFSNYNNLPLAQLATAYHFADPLDSVDECATATDVGGFAFQLPEFNLVLANSRGTYLEIETGSDPHYDSTGLHRMHVNTCGTLPADSCVKLHTAIGPTAGPPQQEGGVSAGVFWATSDDPTLRYLGNQTYLDVTSANVQTYFNNTPDFVQFTVEYVLLAQGILVTEQYTLQPGLASVQAQVSYVSRNHSVVTRLGVTFPAFTFDGLTNASVTLPSSPSNASSSAVLASLNGTSVWGAQSLSVNPGSGKAVAWSTNGMEPTRNGYAQVVLAEVTPVSGASASVAYVLGPSAGML